MNYQAVYDRLMERARSRTLTGYSEKHHVLPRCLGGTDAPENIVVLTPEEHYVAHLVLVRIHPGHKGLIWAAMAMTNGTGNQQRRNKAYGWLRRQFRERVVAANVGRTHTDEARKRMSQTRRGLKRKPHSEETKQRMRAAALGKVKSEAHRAAMSASKTGKKRGPHSAEHRERIRASNKVAVRDLSFTQAPAYRAQQSAQMKAVWQRRREGLLPPRSTNVQQEKSKCLPS